MSYWPRMASSSTSSQSSVTRARLETLTAEIRACRICRDAPQGRQLPHEPRPVLRPSASARLVVAGQAPGTRVHRSGTPFTDPSGDRLRAWMGVTSEEFYDDRRIAILPMGFCFPGLDAKGGDLPPRPECAPAWRHHLLAAMPQTEVILAIGQYAHWWHLPGPRSPVTQTVRRFAELLEQPFAPGRPLCLPLPHPSWRNNAWIKANPWFDADVLPALRRTVRRLITDNIQIFSD